MCTCAPACIQHAFLMQLDKFHLKPVKKLKEIDYLCTLNINLHLQSNSSYEKNCPLRFIGHDYLHLWLFAIADPG
jgi:hypothetical protein